MAKHFYIGFILEKRLTCNDRSERVGCPVALSVKELREQPFYWIYSNRHSYIKSHLYLLKLPFWELFSIKLLINILGAAEYSYGSISHSRPAQARTLKRIN
jgi:hypothetical protein